MRQDFFPALFRVGVIPAFPECDCCADFCKILSFSRSIAFISSFLLNHAEPNKAPNYWQALAASGNESEKLKNCSTLVICKAARTRGGTATNRRRRPFFCRLT